MWMIFLLSTAVCAVGWYVYSLSTEALVYYMKEKGYTPPTEAETKECIRRVIKRRQRR